MPAGPIITLVGTAVFILSALAAPRRGLVARVLARQRDRARADAAELLRLVYEAAEAGTDFADLAATKAWSPARVRALVSAAVRAGHATVDPGVAEFVRIQREPRAEFSRIQLQPVLTPRGQVKAIEVVRRDRLWRLLIADYPDLASLARPLTDEPVEDTLPADVVADLTSKLKAAGRWPEAESVAEAVR